jgi:hypothetical protein
MFPGDDLALHRVSFQQQYATSFAAGSPSETFYFQCFAPLNLDSLGCP